MCDCTEAARRRHHTARPAPERAGYEAWDDANDNNEDGCTAACSLPRPCGDVINQTGVEECDDGNGNDQDDCLERVPDQRRRSLAAFALGFNHSCAVRLREVLRCWGDNRWGQLGIGSNIFNCPTPNTTVNLTSVLSVAAGGNNTCVLQDDGIFVLPGQQRRGAARRWSGS